MVSIAKPKHKKRLDNQIFIWFLGLLVVLQMSTVWLAYSASRENVEQQIRQRLETAQYFFNAEFDSRRKYLTGFVKTIAKDWGFRQAVGQADESTINSMIINFSLRLGADVGLFIDAEGDLRGSSLTLDSNSMAEIDQLIDAAEFGQDPSDYLNFFLAVDDRVYQFVVASMKAPTHIGWVAMGFSIDDELVQNFNAATGLETTFVGYNGTSASVLATTLSSRQINTFGVEKLLADGQKIKLVESSRAYIKPGFLGRASRESNSSSIRHYYVDNKIEGMQLQIPIKTGTSLDLSVLLHQSIGSQLQGFNAWWTDLLLLFSFTLLVSALAVAWIARRITSPLRKLVNVIRQITSGDYQQEIDLLQNNEIGALAEEFQSMQGAVAMREKEIRYRADHDVLTGMQNRDKFLSNCRQNIEQLQARHSPYCLAILLFDINQFANVNEALGHAAGDQLLATIACRVNIDFEHQYVARISADQFAVAFSYFGTNDLHKSIHRLQQCFVKPFMHTGIDILLSITTGSASYPENGNDAIQLLRSADVAMTAAKKKRLDYLAYTPILDSDSVKRLALMSDLPAAIDGNQLVLFYQPTLTLSPDGKHRVSKVECLVRWQHPVYGFIPPDDFIALAEQTGIITRLTYWVIKVAMEQHIQWREQGIELDFAVNISAVDLFRGNLQSLIPALLKHFDIQAQRLVIEVTEGEVMQDPQKAIAILAELANVGVRLSVDDYGTGYSSLSYLKQLPVHELKIDKSFVLGLPENKDDEIIVRSTIDMARTMGLVVVAEGVENAAALALLQQRGCHYAQGFYISKPLPANELERWLLSTDYQVGDGRNVA